jgi:hypothetical protein
MTDASGSRLQRAPRRTPARPTPVGAHELLGADHPLARAEHRVRWLGRQAATLAALLPVGALALLAGAPGLRAALLAGALVEACLLVALSAAVGAIRERALDLIADGRGTLPLASVRRQRARLLRPRHVRRLAEAIEALRREARCPYHRSPMSRPLYVPAVIRAVDAELAATARVLRAQPEATTVGRIERLLGAASSPLYGDEAKRLREELARIHFGAADANHRANSVRERTPSLR